MLNSESSGWSLGSGVLVQLQSIILPVCVWWGQEKKRERERGVRKREREREDNEYTQPRNINKDHAL